MKLRVLFMGTPAFAAASLKRLLELPEIDVVGVFCQPDKPAGRKLILQSPPTKVLAQEHGISVYQPVKLRTEEAFSLISELKPDLIVTAAYGKILPENILHIPPLGCLNVHASLLPKYRGSAPIQWAILQGESQTGITLMKMDVGMDTGDIILQEPWDIGIETTTPELMTELAQVGATLLADNLMAYAEQKLPLFPQDDTLATYSPPIKKEQGLIDWQQSAWQIYNQIRALAQWPGAYTYFEGKRYKLHKARCFSSEELNFAGMTQEPGRVVSNGKDAFLVATGEGYLEILQIQLPSGKTLAAQECSHNFPVGQGFGDA